MTALISELVKLIGKVSYEQLHFLSPLLSALVEVSKTNDGLEQLDPEEFREHLGLGKVLPEPTITELPGVTLVGSEVSLEDQKAAGEYEFMDDNTTAKHFPLTLPAGPQSLVLAYFVDVDVQRAQVEIWAAMHDYEVALIDDLLAVGSHSEYKELQRQFPIIALGSSAVFDGDLHVPFLYGDDSNRGLYLEYGDYLFDEGLRFLLRKIKPLPMLSVIDRETGEHLGEALKAEVVGAHLEGNFYPMIHFRGGQHACHVKKVDGAEVIVVSIGKSPFLKSPFL